MTVVDLLLGHSTPERSPGGRCGVGGGRRWSGVGKDGFSRSWTSTPAGHRTDARAGAGGCPGGCPGGDQKARAPSRPSSTPSHAASFSPRTRRWQWLAWRSEQSRHKARPLSTKCVSRPSRPRHYRSPCAPRRCGACRRSGRCVQPDVRRAGCRSRVGGVSRSRPWRRLRRARESRSLACAQGRAENLAAPQASRHPPAAGRAARVPGSQVSAPRAARRFRHQSTGCNVPRRGQRLPWCRRPICTFGRRCARGRHRRCDDPNLIPGDRTGLVMATLS